MNDKMREEFEREAARFNLNLRRNIDSYWWGETEAAWQYYELGYIAGQKAEREQLENLLPRAVREGLKIVSEYEQ